MENKPLHPIRCPYATPMNCERVRKKLQEVAIDFRCQVCLAKHCATFRYDRGLDLCWVCGIKLPAHRLQQFKTSQTIVIGEIDMT